MEMITVSIINRYQITVLTIISKKEILFLKITFNTIYKIRITKLMSRIYNKNLVKIRINNN